MAKKILPHTRSLRSSHDDLPILAIAGSFSGQFMKVPVALGAVGALEKPFKQVDLLAKVDKVLGKKGGPTS